MRRIISGAAALLVVLSLSALTPSVDARPAPADHSYRAAAGRTIHYNGWGGLRLGMGVRKAWRTGMVSHEHGHCAPGYEMARRYRERGFASWRETRPNGGPHYTAFKVQMIIVRGSQDRTAAGAHPGTTLRELRRLYPDLSRVRRASRLEHQSVIGKKDLWVASTSRKSGALSFHFPYGLRPKSGAKVEYVVVSRKPTVWWGC